MLTLDTHLRKVPGERGRECVSGGVGENSTGEVSLRLVVGYMVPVGGRVGGWVSPGVGPVGGCFGLGGVWRGGAGVPLPTHVPLIRNRGRVQLLDH